MEVNNVRCCDTAALVALINMLKVNLGSTPEIYNTLLAVLCDFDPCKHGNRDRTVRYIRLLVTDKVLANCLLMSLPQGAAELQDLPLYTGSLPDMKRAIRHKFLGMKLSVKSPQVRSEEKSKEPVNVTNQNITIIVTDQDETKSTSLQDTYNRSILQTEPSLSEQGNDGAASKTTSSQTKCIITFTKSSLNGLGKDSPTASMKSSVSVDSSASRAAQSSQPASSVKSGNQSGNMIGHSVSSVRSMLESQSQPNHVLGAKVSGTESYSKLDNLITLVKSRTEGKSNVLQDCTTTSIQGHTTNVIPSPAYQGGKKNYSSPWSDQQFSQNQKLNVHPNTQHRLPNPLVPLLYQQYAYPIPGSTSYQSCLTGYTANPLLPWTPLTYIPGYSQNQHYPVGPTLQFGRPSSTSVSDATLDLSIQKKPYSQTQSSQNENNRNIQAYNETRKGEKRCASASCLPNDNESKEPKQKVRRLSTDVPIFSATRYVPPNKEDAMKSQRFPATAASTEYLCLADNRERKDENQPNSLQALQELTFRINGNTGLRSTSSLNPLIPRKSLSTGSFSDSWQQLRLHHEQKSKATGKPDITNIASSLEALKRYSVPSTQKLLLPSNSPTAAAKSLTKIPQVSASRQFHLATPAARQDNIITTCIPPKPVQIHIETTLMQQEANCTISHRTSAIMSSSIVQNQKAVETNVAVIPSDMKQKSSVCLRSFPYSQHIQLPDGNFSVVDFPSLLSQNTTHSAKTPMPSGQMDTKSHEPSNLNFQSGIFADNVKTLCGARSDEIATEGNVKDSISRYSLYLKRSDTSSQTAEKVNSQTAVSPADLQSNVGETEQTKSNETCLIIETTSENGTEQVQFKLDKKSSANLLGELLKLKPGANSSAADQIAGNSRDSPLNRSEFYREGHAFSQRVAALENDGHSSHQSRAILSNDGDDDVYTPMECYETLSENIESGQGGHTKTKYNVNSEPESTFSSLNVSPYLLGMLPDTTTFTDDDEEEQEEYSDCDDGDDDVFLHPFF